MGSRTPSARTSSREDYTSIPLKEIDDSKWRQIFDELNPDENDEVSMFNMEQRLKELAKRKLPQTSVRALLKWADKDQNEKISFTEFLEVVKHEAIGRMIIRTYRTAALGVLTKHEREKYNRVKRLPIFMVSISVLEVALFIYHSNKLYKTHGYIGPNGPVPVDSRIIYNPIRRFEAWRFVSYMLVHSGYLHVISNVLIQLILGIPLEMAHSWWRILIVYLAGVVAGSLGSSITDPHVFLAGASGGVYAIMAAHLAALVLNWAEMRHCILRVLGIGIFAAADVGVAIYYRHVGVATDVSYVAHFAGAMAGLLVGVVVLRNLEKHKWEKIVSATGFSLYIILMIFAIAWNVFYLPADPATVDKTQ